MKECLTVIVNLLNLIVNKLISGRFLMAIMFSLTGCYMAVRGILPTEAFAGLLTLIVREYWMQGRKEPIDTPKP